MRTAIFRVAAAVIVGLFSLAAHADPLQVALEPGSAGGTVQVSLTNTGTNTLSVLLWDTPFEKTLSSDVFHVESARKGWPMWERAVYVGREVKRGEPAEDQFFMLEPGSTISQSVELNDYYHIDKAGNRKVRFAGHFRYVELDTPIQGYSNRKSLSTDVSEMSITEMQSNSVQVSVVPEISLRLVTPAYNNCSVDEQSDIVAAAQLAQDYVNTGIADLQSLATSDRSASPRYTTWFGEYTEERFDQVVANFEAIGTALEDEQIRFDCGCDESGVYAYVYPNRPYDVFLCPAFRSARVGGTDSRAGTIVHELSHFTILADTDDHVYSQRGAQSLASTDPAKAITNADNHEYFAENTPELDILGTSAIEEPEILALDTPVTSNVAQGSSDIYQVSGASQITVTSLSGDADLTVYTDPALTAESCNSSAAADVDICENFVEGTVYIRVFGYLSASYTIEATAGVDTTPAESSVITLAVDTTVSGALDVDERVVYEVSGAVAVELESLTGDANLYIFESLEFTDASLVCVSDQGSGDSLSDTCILPTPADTYYLMVVGFTATDYSLIASTSSIGSGDVPESVDMGRLVVGNTASESIAAGQSHFFVVSGASAVQLTSLTGNADLSVYATSDYSEDSLVCRSDQFPADSLVDACDIPSGADHYIGVFGYEDTTYNLTATAAPEDDDGTPGVPVEGPDTDVPPVVEGSDTDVPPVVEGPDTDVPPVVEGPDTDVPPVVEGPDTDVPVVEGPDTDVPVVEAPDTDVPVVEGPDTDVPVVEGPDTDVPVVEGPDTDVPVVEAPDTDVPVVEGPDTDVPVVEGPDTDVPVVVDPDTDVPVVEAPDTDVPVIDDPSTPVVPVDPLAPENDAQTPVASSGGSSGSGSLNFWLLGLLIVTLGYRRVVTRRI